MNSRIKKLRDELDLSQTDFGKRIGATRNQISFAEGDGHNVSDIMITAICERFNVSETWIRTGEGRMFAEEGNDEADLEAFRRVLKAKVKRLPPEAQSIVLELCLEIQNAIGETEPSPQPEKKDSESPEP